MHAIDRRAVVSRHDIRVTEPGPERVLSVGNGDFAVTVDASGMQSFPDYHDQQVARDEALARDGDSWNEKLVVAPAVVATCTMTSWGWHETPTAERFTLDDAMTDYATGRGIVSYPDRADVHAAGYEYEAAPSLRAGSWLHANPHRLDLGRVGLRFQKSPHSPIETDPSVLRDLDQRQDLWTGTVTTRYRYEDEEVTVQVVADPDRDVVAYRISSSLLADGRATVTFRFPRPSSGFILQDIWAGPETHHTEVVDAEAGRGRILRRLDATGYTVDIASRPPARLLQDGPHSAILTASATDLDLVVRFSPEGSASTPLPTFEEVSARAEEAAERFWSSGAAIDFGGVDDPRAGEIERRVVLSQHLTRVHSASIRPPQETGLATSSWHGKFHVEMHLWHAAHWAAWGRPDLLEKAMPWYLAIADSARETARRQGYPGLRWPKMVGPDGRESPSEIGALLAWQQPHPIHLLELLWQAVSEEDRPRVLETYGTIVSDTASFMAAYPQEREGALHLGPPIMPAQEFYDAPTTFDPTFELAYWWYGLELAQRWRERAGEPRHDGWAAVQSRLVSPRQQDGRYLAVASSDVLRRDDHPSMVAALGVVPLTPLIDPEVMRRTLLDVLDGWDWSSAWGWDFPMMAMTATRLHEPELAVDILLRDERRNRYTVVGHNPQLGPVLPIYLPGNGGLLLAVALMAAGADETRSGFPSSWQVEVEGFAVPPEDG